VAVALVAVVLQAQDQPTFRTGANYVRVDMYATVDGKSIEDLTAEEVEVLEDDVAQKVEAFERVRVSPAGPQELRREPNTVEESRQMAAEARARIFVIFLDTYHTTIEGSSNMRLPLIKFLDRLLGPDDMVALMTPEMGASEITLGRKTTVISNIMQAQWMWGRRGRLVDDDPKELLYQECYGIGSLVDEMKARRREKLTLDALADLMVHLTGVREERKGLVVVSEGWQLFRSNPSLTSGDTGLNRVRPEDILKRSPRPAPSDGGTSTTPSTRVECEADRVALASLDHTQRLREITEEANRGNVTFYPVYARGLVAFDAPIGPDKAPTIREDQANLRVKQDGLRFLADNTDGISIVNTNNIDAMLQRIVDDLSSYYLFGYYSTNTKLDGRFRNISVRVKRPGARVRARRGYRGRTADDLISGAAGAAAAEAPDSLTAALTPVVGFNARSQFRIRTSSWTRQGTGNEPPGAFWVVGEIDYRTRRELAWTASAKADVVVLASDGTEIMSKSLEVRTEDGPFAFEVPDSGGLVAGEYAVRVRLTSAADSGQVLSDTARVVLTQTTSLGEAVMWRRGPTTGLQHRRTADPRFLRSERLRLEHPTTLPGAATARMLDRNGKPLNVPVQVTDREDTGGFRWIVVDASLAPFAPGDYAIEVTQGTAKQVTGFRVVP
jgi:VWFA-related protein